MLELPILNVRLRACAEDWPQMTPTARGHHCAQCDHEVVDFTQSTQAELAAARLTAPGGKLCGRFLAAQLASDQPSPMSRRPALRPKLRRFLVALVLVCGLGLTSQEAGAQVRRAAISGQHPGPERAAATPQNPPRAAGMPSGGMPAAPQRPEQATVYGQVETMPEFRDGGSEGVLRFIGRQLRYPAAARPVEGRVFVGFTVGATGQLREFQVLKSLHPALDAEALRVVRLLNGRFRPGRRNGQPVDVRYTIPVTFQLP